MRVRGSWPNPVILRRGWALAHARPWNRSRPDAHLRLVRGSSGFLTAAADLVLDLGSVSVISPPLLAGAQQPWLRAGFVPYAPLRLMRKQVGPTTTPERPVTVVADDQWRRIVAVDAAAFGDKWKADLPALTEALRSASTANVLGTFEGALLVGYAIVAVSSPTAYLQRIAVDPAYQRSGIGRSLTRAAHEWARRRGARWLVLNTKPNNDAALELYLSEGFETLPDRLELLQYPSSS